MAPADRTAASQLVVSQSQTVDAAASVHAKINAPRGETSPVTSGRFTVRCMCASMSRSRYMLNAAADPALIEPPSTVARTSQMSGSPPCARIMTGTVVTSRSSSTRGFVSATYARIVRPRECGRAAAADAAPAVIVVSITPRSTARNCPPSLWHPHRRALRSRAAHSPVPCGVSTSTPWRHDTDTNRSDAPATLPSYDVSHSPGGIPLRYAETTRAPLRRLLLPNCDAVC